MPKTENERITETATEARQAEPGPSVLMLLVVSVGLRQRLPSELTVKLSGMLDPCERESCRPGLNIEKPGRRGTTGWRNTGDLN